MQISLVDVEKLARGEPIAHESFLAILLSPTALARVSAVRDMQQMFEPARGNPAPREDGSSPNVAGELLLGGESQAAPPAEMPCSFAELAEFLEQGSLDPSRAAVAESFLAKNFPEAIADRAHVGERSRRVAAADPVPPRTRGESELG